MMYGSGVTRISFVGNRGFGSPRNNGLTMGTIGSMMAPLIYCFNRKNYKKFVGH